jgi:PEP-CTERM motif
MSYRIATILSHRSCCNCVVGLWVAACAAALAVPTEAQLITSATGQIELRINPAYDHQPHPPFDPLYPKIESTPIGLADTAAWMDGSGYEYVDGIVQVDYKYMPTGPGQAWFNIDAITHADSVDDNGGGWANLELSLYIQAPIYYRFTADAYDCHSRFSVSFNDVSAEASLDMYGNIAGTFPFILNDPYDPNSGYAGWDTYVDEGFLPAGLYDLMVESFMWTSGSASLYIQMQGDTNLDGFVGIEDLNTVLGNWNDHVPVGMAQFGDLSRDGYVGMEDLNQVLSCWNVDIQPPSIAVPEPTTGMLLGMVSLGLLSRRRR